jgi:hypothetical protein
MVRIFARKLTASVIEMVGRLAAYRWSKEMNSVYEGDVHSM